MDLYLARYDFNSGAKVYTCIGYNLSKGARAPPCTPVITPIGFLVYYIYKVRAELRSERDSDDRAVANN